MSAVSTQLNKKPIEFRDVYCDSLQHQLRLNNVL
jgi:hypothetical protein